MTYEEVQAIQEMFLKKINNNIRFDEDEIDDLIEYFCYDEIDGDNNRWTQDVTTIIEIDGKLYKIDWQRALTEMQANNYYGCDVVEVEEKTKTITVNYYEEKGDEENE